MVPGVTRGVIHRVSVASLAPRARTLSGSRAGGLGYRRAGLTCSAVVGIEGMGEFFEDPPRSGDSGRRPGPKAWRRTETGNRARRQRANTGISRSGWVPLHSTTSSVQLGLNPLMVAAGRRSTKWRDDERRDAGGDRPDHQPPLRGHSPRGRSRRLLWSNVRRPRSVCGPVTVFRLSLRCFPILSGSPGVGIVWWAMAVSSLTWRMRFSLSRPGSGLSALPRLSRSVSARSRPSRGLTGSYAKPSRRIVVKGPPSESLQSSWEYRLKPFTNTGYRHRRGPAPEPERGVSQRFVNSPVE